MASSNDQGFVLPYVLVVIAILAIATTIAADRLQKSTSILLKIKDQKRIERQLYTAEAEAIYGWLTGISVEGGIDLNSNNPVISDLGFAIAEGSVTHAGRDFSDLERDLWGGDGGKRVSIQKEGDVIIVLRDVAGLVSLSAGEDEAILAVLETLEVSKDKARGLVAKLRDYTDADNNRQFAGGERADYRLRNMSVPTNSPLRNYAELNRILEWGDTIENIDFEAFQEMTTLQPRSKVKKIFSSPELIDVLRLDQPDIETESTVFNIEDLEAGSTSLSDTSRLTFWIKGDGASYHKRVIEVKRRSGNYKKPYRKFWVYDAIVLEDDLGLDLNSKNEIKNVIHAASIRLP